MKKLLFSILVPTYKAKFLKECIDSVLSQTYTNFELIIVNDASPEDIDSIVSICSDDRLRYYKNKKNIGAVDVVDNWNLCLSYAVGDYVICMGDDDKLTPNCLEEYLKLIEKYPKLEKNHCIQQSQLHSVTLSIAASTEGDAGNKVLFVYAESKFKGTFAGSS